MHGRVVVHIIVGKAWVHQEVEGPVRPVPIQALGDGSILRAHAVLLPTHLEELGVITDGHLELGDLQAVR
eukprot:8226753-Alexandrium_andersonii.AAC.1